MSERLMTRSTQKSTRRDECTRTEKENRCTVLLKMLNSICPFLYFISAGNHKFELIYSFFFKFLECYPVLVEGTFTSISYVIMAQNVRIKVKIMDYMEFLAI